MHLWVALYTWLPRTGSPAARQAGRAVALLAMADFARNFRVIMLSDFNKIEGRRGQQKILFLCFFASCPTTCSGTHFPSILLQRESAVPGQGGRRRRRRQESDTL